MIESQIQVRIDQFDGPLALLLHLVQKQEMNVRELDINNITQEYLNYLKYMQSLDFDVAGDYLYMAASLLHIKSENITEEESKKLAHLVGDGEVLTTKSELINKLEELEKYRRLGDMIWSLQRRDEDIFVRPKVDRKAVQNSILSPISSEGLIDSMVDLIRREKRKYTVVKRDRLSIREKLEELKNSLSVGNKTTLNNLIKDRQSTEETVITFISLLELARLKKLNIYQNKSMGEVYVEVEEDLNSFDVETADGFEPESEGAVL